MKPSNKCKIIENTTLKNIRSTNGKETRENVLSKYDNKQITSCLYQEKQKKTLYKIMLCFQFQFLHYQIKSQNNLQTIEKKSFIRDNLLLKLIDLDSKIKTKTDVKYQEMFIKGKDNDLDKDLKLEKSSSYTFTENQNKNTSKLGVPANQTRGRRLSHDHIKSKIVKQGTHVQTVRKSHLKKLETISKLLDDQLFESDKEKLSLYQKEKHSKL